MYLKVELGLKANSEMIGQRDVTVKLYIDQEEKKETKEIEIISCTV